MKKQTGRVCVNKTADCASEAIFVCSIAATREFPVGNANIAQRISHSLHKQNLTNAVISLTALDLAFNSLSVTNFCFTLVVSAGKCLAEGLVDVTDCYYGFPIALSYPHFLDADPALLEGVTGSAPNREKHESFFILNPVSFNYRRTAFSPVFCHERLRSVNCAKSPRHVQDHVLNSRSTQF